MDGAGGHVVDPMVVDPMQLLAPVAPASHSPAPIELTWAGAASHPDIVEPAHSTQQPELAVFELAGPAIPLELSDAGSTQAAGWSESPPCSQPSSRSSSIAPCDSPRRAPVAPPASHPRCSFDNPSIVAQYPQHRGTKRMPCSPSASLSPSLSPMTSKSKLLHTIQEGHKARASPQGAPSRLNLFAKPFMPQASPAAPHASTQPAEPETVGTPVDSSGEWELERVREFTCYGELEDFEELDQLEKVSAALEGSSESDYTSSTEDSVDEEEFEATRSRQLSEFKQFSSLLQQRVAAAH